MDRQDGSWSGWLVRRGHTGRCRGRSPRPSSGERPSTSCTRGSSLYALYEGTGPVPVDPELLEQGSWAILDKAIASVATTGIDLTAMLVEGEPAPVLTQVAAGADLLVVGSEGHGGLAGRLLGSVSQRCIESAPCPVVVVPHDAKPRTRTIVVGVDGSEPSCAALRWAVAEATRRRTPTGSRERLPRKPGRPAVRTVDIV